MTRVLKSYLSGTFVAGTGRAAKLYDPARGTVVAETSTEGLDIAGALDYARDVGGPALRELTFAQRGELLSAMASALHEYRDELLDLARLNGGNTRGDAKFDIDGCTGTLAFYGKLGGTLGDRTFFVDGESEQLARNPRYIGQHIRVPRHGVAVHINAFNFPGWGFGEKAAVALLAGMPVLCKPGTSTSLVTARMFEILAAADVLPKGAVSLLCGSAGSLLDHLGPQDAVAFTGSSGTGAMIRGRANLLAAGVPVNVEADSLNSAVLGPDVDDESETFDMFVRETARDMWQKAGQKCTAIRRIYVPRESLDDVREALIGEIQRNLVGDPGLKQVRVGPVATAQQHRDVKEGIQTLAKEGRFVYGDGGPGTLEGEGLENGYFVGPTLLEVDGPGPGAVHDLEVFGPVQTLIPYDGTAAEAIPSVARGKGSLVSSVYTDDKNFARDMILGLAPYNGRLHLGGRKVADHSPGPGTVLPQMVHGGPGRAGGGEELGGVRGLHFYMQRTAVQGLKPLIERIAGV
ncbi:MAG: 3,4-dehydroadipyl-CoA semialdehyde dehydrogenase [Deltaproteobacteria bacterium]|nr:3,4-dehydroadipyl-CoA semialdehyde dehydrogenase [Deltaproteobacteria bacterium]